MFYDLGSFGKIHLIMNICEFMGTRYPLVKHYIYIKFQEHAKRCLAKDAQFLPAESLSLFQKPPILYCESIWLSTACEQKLCLALIFLKLTYSEKKIKINKLINIQCQSQAYNIMIKVFYMFLSAHQNQRTFNPLKLLHALLPPTLLAPTCWKPPDLCI